MFSLGQAEMPCTRRSVSKQYKVVYTLKFKRTRTENLLILRWSENRLSQVLTLFYSRIPEQNFRFGMIYDCLFESVWFTFREKVAPAKQTFGSLQVVIRVMNDKLQKAEESNDET